MGGTGRFRDRSRGVREAFYVRIGYSLPMENT